VTGERHEFSPAGSKFSGIRVISEKRRRDEPSMRMRGGVYPPVAKESVCKDKTIKGIRSVPWDDDGDEGSPSD
jgi:hypothetical protein